MVAGGYIDNDGVGVLLYTVLFRCLCAQISPVFEISSHDVGSWYYRYTADLAMG